MRTLQTTVYRVSELSETAFERAREHYANHLGETP